MNDTRVVVAGGGMAGLCAAVAASDVGAQVTVVEKSRILGGSMRMSGSLVWTYQDEETAERLIPDGNPVLQSLVIDGLEEALAWLAQSGVDVGREVSPRRNSFGREITPSQLISAMAKKLESNGAVIEFETGLSAVIRDSQTGVIRAVEVVGGCDESKRRTIDTDAVILATGGFQGNAELVSRLLGVRPEDVQLRSNRWSTGDALVAAQAVGAAMTPGISTYYGHAVAAPPAAFPPHQMREASQFYGSLGVAINRDGKRFVDEAGGSGEEYVNAALGKQPGGLGFYIVDAELAGSVAGPGLKIQATIDRAISYGAPYAKGNTLEELCDGLGQLGVSGAQALATLTAYNGLMDGGRQSDLVPPRSGEANGLCHPPFQAVGVQSGLTFTMGGIAVDEEMRVLERSRSTSTMRGPMDGFSDVVGVTIPGLFATGCDIGGINSGGYMGGLAAALVTGRLAGERACAGGPA